ncbi:hypothetical protein HMPREF1424_00411 [Helicobacter pylori GAM42Ai]|nr:hypothetical protein HMPREF1424_00411 [Helicobacter pylori GAM42Ai]
MLNIGCKSVKSVFKIQLKAFKSNAKKQKKAKNDTIFSKLQKKRFHAIIRPMFNTSKYFKKGEYDEKNPFTLSLSLVFAPR